MEHFTGIRQRRFQDVAVGYPRHGGRPVVVTVRQAVHSVLLLVVRLLLHDDGGLPLHHPVWLGGLYVSRFDGRLDTERCGRGGDAIHCLIVLLVLPVLDLDMFARRIGEQREGGMNE